MIATLKQNLKATYSFSEFNEAEQGDKLQAQADGLDQNLLKRLKCYRAENKAIGRCSYIVF